MNLQEGLLTIGFTRQEAVLYLTLLEQGELTGYEAARNAGIAKSNAYLSLSSLVEKGGGYRIDGQPARFAAVPTAELVASARRRMTEALTFLEQHAPAQKPPRSAFLTITGRERVLDTVRNLLETAAKRIYLSVSPENLKPVQADLEEACQRGLKVVVISSPPYTLPGATVYLREKRPGRIRLIVDSTRVLMGELGAQNAECVLSENVRLVELIKDSLTDEMKLIGEPEKPPLVRQPT